MELSALTHHWSRPFVGKFLSTHTQVSQENAMRIGSRPAALVCHFCFPCKSQQAHQDAALNCAGPHFHVILDRLFARLRSFGNTKQGTNELVTFFYSPAILRGQLKEQKEEPPSSSSSSVSRSVPSDPFSSCGKLISVCPVHRAPGSFFNRSTENDRQFVSNYRVTSRGSHNKQQQQQQQ